MSDQPPNPPPVALPIDGVLDLHTFNPREIGRLVPDYLDECRQRGLLEVRIIHGKGIGNLQRTVHSILAKRRDVARYAFASPAYGGRGATIVTLSPR
jgi:DNA-nicking Smr family endonuclease